MTKGIKMQRNNFSWQIIFIPTLTGTINVFFMITFFKKHLNLLGGLGRYIKINERHFIKFRLCLVLCYDTNK